MAIFQMNVAKRWRERGQDYKVDPYGQFFFYFAGFNALYFLWGRIDDVRNSKGEPAGEEKQIEYVLRKLEESEAERILKIMAPTVAYFIQRPPVQRMNKRNAESQTLGDKKEGKKWRNKLSGSASSIEKLVALGHILYLVRSNLVHGSKALSGDDKDIIENSVPALKEILNCIIDITRQRFGFGL